MSSLYYVRREWIVQRLSGMVIGGGAEEWADFNTTPKSRDQMESEVERLTGTFPAEEFRGHNIAFCDCHPVNYKRGKLQ